MMKEFKFESELELDLFIAKFILKNCNQSLITIDCNFDYSINKIIIDIKNFLYQNELVSIDKK